MVGIYDLNGQNVFFDPNKYDSFERIYDYDFDICSERTFLQGLRSFFFFGIDALRSKVKLRIITETLKMEEKIVQFKINFIII